MTVTFDPWLSTCFADLRDAADGDGGNEESEPVQKADEGPVGDVKARHLIRWFNEGADGQIPWGTPGSFEACVRVATEHAGDRMTPEEIKGFCANRYHDSTGMWPGRHGKVAKEFDPAETRDEHGQWSTMGAVEHAVESVIQGADGRKGSKVSDRLKIANRIPLDHGEHLVGSSKVNGETGTVRLAATSKNGHPSLRLGIGGADYGSRDSETGTWTAGPDNTVAMNAGRAKLRDEQKRLEGRWNELDAAKPLSPADQTELKSVEDRLNELDDTDKGDVYPDGFTAKLSEPAAEQLRSTLSDALDKGVKAAADADAKWDEIDRLKAQQDQFRSQSRGMQRKWTDTEEAEWDALAAKIEALEAEANGDGKGYQVFAEGSVPGEWADVHYRVELDDDPSVGLQVHLGAVPHGSGRDLSDLSGEEAAANFDPAETRQLLRQLGALAAPRPNGEGG